MIKSFIKKRIQCLEIQDVCNFAHQNGIKLNNQEANIIFKYIKEDWKELIFQDHSRILNEAKPHLEINTYQKIEELINLYKNKYKNYL